MQQNTCSNAKSKENDSCAAEKHLFKLFGAFSFCNDSFMIVNVETQET